MIEHESQHESSSGTPSDPPAESDAVSTVAMPAGAIPPLGEEYIRSSPPVVVSGGSSFIAGASTPAAVVPTDKTVISKRPPVDSPLPPLPTPQSLGLALIGKTLDHYELVEFVGGGGMGAVFRSIDTRLGRTVAVKVLSRDHTDEETIKRFRNEAQSAARLDHPNIARVYFVGEAEGWNYIVFEFIEGTNLRDIVDTRGPLPLEEALDYTLQVAEALDHASNRDVVHRDIKPSNVLVTPEGQAKLVDMGLARLHQVESSSEDLTASGVMLGTFDYISPEQARDPRSADVRSDIYSLGCTLYFMLTGRPPFPEGTAVQKLLKHNSEEPPDLRLFRPELPAAVTALVGRMLAKRPSQRQQAPQELIAEVLGLAHQLGLSGLTRQASAALTVSPPARSFWSRLLPIAVPIAALVLLLLLIDSLSRQTDKPQDFVQRPTFSAGKAEQSLITGQEDDAANVSADSAAEKSSDPTIGTTIDNGQNGSGVNDSPAETNADNTAAAGGKQGERPSIGDGSAESTALQVADSASDMGSQAAGGSSSSSILSSDPLREVRRVIVRKNPTSAPVPDNSEIVHSLARACQVAAEHKVDKIELEFDGALSEPEQPLELRMQRVEIFAAENPSEPGSRYRPVIVFQPPPFGTDADRQMIRLSGGSRSQITFRGVELRLELPSEPSVGWSLLALYQLQSLELIDSVLTVKCPGGAQGLVGYEPVAMLALQPYRPAEMMKMTDDMMAMLPSINVRLTNCIARGEATFFSAIEERPLNLAWNQGLLVTPLRLLDTGGCNLMKPSSQDKFEIILDHVTAIVPEGLVRQNRGAMPSHLRLEVTCRDSVLQWDRDATLFEFVGLPSESDIKLRYLGYNNLHPQPQPAFLQRKSVGGALAMDPLPFEPTGQWWDDSSADKLIWDPEPPPLSDLPAHEHLPQHYLLSEGSSKGEGFDVNLLPKLELPEDNSPAATGTEADFFDRPVSP